MCSSISFLPKIESMLCKIYWDISISVVQTVVMTIAMTTAISISVQTAATTMIVVPMIAVDRMVHLLVQMHSQTTQNQLL